MPHFGVSLYSIHPFEPCVLFSFNCNGPKTRDLARARRASEELNAFPLCSGLKAPTEIWGSLVLGAVHRDGQIIGSGCLSLLGAPKKNHVLASLSLLTCSEGAQLQSLLGSWWSKFCSALPPEQQ